MDLAPRRALALVGPGPVALYGPAATGTMLSKPKLCHLKTDLMSLGTQNEGAGSRAHEQVPTLQNPQDIDTLRSKATMPADGSHSPPGGNKDVVVGVGVLDSEAVTGTLLAFSEGPSKLSLSFDAPADICLCACVLRCRLSEWLQENLRPQWPDSEKPFPQTEQYEHWWGSLGFLAVLGFLVCTGLCRSSFDGLSKALPQTEHGYLLSDAPLSGCFSPLELDSEISLASSSPAPEEQSHKEITFFFLDD
ncbi:hypothetical protein EYF80_034518 [Liparis tanakae]|uniref:Uncharacterized protein n=1 Tax=Liparis tanakae TaxID=230148 RepID=A0A4Z2GRB2_9TELE|nr:hypothetical protein EYF80_034518 [Liparis tanakae]